MNRPRRVIGLAGLLLASLLVGGCSGDEYVAAPPPQGSEVAEPAVAADTVAALQEAVVAGDTAEAAALGTDGDARTLLAAVAANASALGLVDVTFRYVTESGRTDPDGWEGLVAVTWRHEGFDDASARLEVPISFAAGGTQVAAIGGDGHPLPVWLSGPVEVRRTPETVVFGRASAAEIGRYARWARRAAADVSGVLDRRTRLVVEVPDDARALHRALGATRDEYAAIAAVTAPVDGSRSPGSPVHVFVNPAVYDALDPVASQVVMTHEGVHAATGAARARRGELWLIEGFADYIALRDLDLPVSRTAGQVIEQVRDEGLPARLPSQTDFDTTGTHLGAVYESAWLVCVALAEQGGRDALVGLYDAVIGGADLEPELRDRFGWSTADLTAAWRSKLADVAGVPE